MLAEARRSPAALAELTWKRRLSLVSWRPYRLPVDVNSRCLVAPFSEKWALHGVGRCMGIRELTGQPHVAAAAAPAAGAPTVESRRPLFRRCWMQRGACSTSTAALYRYSTETWCVGAVLPRWASL